MFRILLNLLLFLLPFLLYAATMYFSKKPVNWRDAPLIWLTLAGFSLFMAMLFVSVFFTQGTGVTD